MKITGRNAAVGQTREDVISKGGELALPTEARYHNIVSNSAEDDNNGILQKETATAAGTIVGIAQVETATISGTVGAAGGGIVNVIVTGALVAGSPLTVPVTVANDDTASQVAGKVRTALGIAAITDNYTVGGTNALVSLTAKAAAANDATLNIAYDNDTASGLTPAASSANTTAGHAGSGNASVVVTSALVEGSPITLNVPVVVGDTASVWAGKVRTALAANAAIAAVFNVGGTGATITLENKTAAANDSTLNIALDNGTCNGITTAASSANTTAGVAGTGAKTVRIWGVDEAGRAVKEVVALNGVAAVTTSKKYLFINRMSVDTAGSGGKNAGLITATAAVDSTVTCQIEVGQNKSQQAAFMFNDVDSANLSYFFVSAYNATSGAVTTIEILVRNPNGVWAVESSFELTETNPRFVDTEGKLFPTIQPRGMFKIAATASAGSSAVTVNCDVED